MWRFALLLIPLPAWADSLVATRTIRAHTELTSEDVTLVAMDIPEAITDPGAAVGLETRIAIYAGKPIHARDLGPSTIVERNQIIPLAYSVGTLSIQTEGRALARGGVGEMIDVMNLTSRTRVTGRIGPDGVVNVSPSS